MPKSLVLLLSLFPDPFERLPTRTKGERLTTCGGRGYYLLEKEEGKRASFFYTGCAKAFGRHKFSLSPPYPLFSSLPRATVERGEGRIFSPKQRRGKGGEEQQWCCHWPLLAFPSLSRSLEFYAPSGFNSFWEPLKPIVRSGGREREKGGQSQREVKDSTMVFLKRKLSHFGGEWNVLIGIQIKYCCSRKSGNAVESFHR